MSTGAGRRSPRRDAVANRERVLAAAAEVFGREGFGAGVETIARAAGVNVATLYRNFPSKSALMLAIGESLLTPLAAARDEVLASADPDVVGRFLARQPAVYRDNQGVIDALGRGDLDAAVRRELVTLASDVLAPIVVRGHADGSLAPEFDVQDLLVALRMVTSALITAAGLERDPRPYLTIVARGLRGSGRLPVSR
jgi:AcrR family transcriptional regulator